jgi:hypothetical protein
MNVLIKYILLILINILITSCVYTQSNVLENFIGEKERVLNVALNSQAFDSIYKSDTIFFVSNELLEAPSEFNLKKEDYPIMLLEKGVLEKLDVSYVSLSDLIILEDNFPYARVQIYSSKSNRTLNLRLEKKDNEWIIVDHLIMDD